MSSEDTMIRVSKSLRDELREDKRYGESYEMQIRRLLRRSRKIDEVSGDQNLRGLL